MRLADVTWHNRGAICGATTSSHIKSLYHLIKLAGPPWLHEVVLCCGSALMVLYYGITSEPVWYTIICISFGKARHHLVLSAGSCTATRTSTASWAWRWWRTRAARAPRRRAARSSATATASRPPPPPAAPRPRRPPRRYPKPHKTEWILVTYLTALQLFHLLRSLKAVNVCDFWK